MRGFFFEEDSGSYFREKSPSVKPELPEDQ